MNLTERLLKIAECYPMDERCQVDIANDMAVAVGLWLQEKRLDTAKEVKLYVSRGGNLSGQEWIEHGAIVELLGNLAEEATE